VTGGDEKSGDLLGYKENEKEKEKSRWEQGGGWRRWPWVKKKARCFVVGGGGGGRRWAEDDRPKHKTVSSQKEKGVWGVQGDKERRTGAAIQAFSASFRGGKKGHLKIYHHRGEKEEKGAARLVSVSGIKSSKQGGG